MKKIGLNDIQYADEDKFYLMKSPSTIGLVHRSAYRNGAFVATALNYQTTQGNRFTLDRKKDIVLRNFYKKL